MAQTGTVTPTHVWVGKQHVRYRAANGTTYDGEIVGAGSTSGVKIKLWRGTGHVVLDNVAKATTAKQTNRYYMADRPVKG